MVIRFSREKSVLVSTFEDVPGGPWFDDRSVPRSLASFVFLGEVVGVALLHSVALLVRRSGHCQIRGIAPRVFPGLCET